MTLQFKRFLLIAGLITCVSSAGDYFTNEVESDVRYDPTWESLDTRPLPQWYDDAKFGIFLHWGVYSVPSFGSEWFWINWKTNSPAYVEFMAKNYAPGTTYQEFAKEFKAEFFNATEWAEIFAQSGAQYVVLTSKHHEGYTMWPSNYSYSWNAMDIGPGRDLVSELAQAVRARGLHFGLYHSLYEWFNPMYLADKKANFTTDVFYRNKVLPEIQEIINNYLPDVLWSDGDWETYDTYWDAPNLLAWLYNSSPVKDTIVTNDRWGIGIPCKHGDFYTCADRYNPGVLQPHKWENAMTVDRKSWGYRRNAKLEDYMSTLELLKEMVVTVSCRGNILMNVGPTKEGTILPIFQDRLREVGNWMSVNGEAIYGTRPWIVQNDTIGETWYTSKNTTIYAFTFDWPTTNILRLGSAGSLFLNGTAVVTLLGHPSELTWSFDSVVVSIDLPGKATVTTNWVWVLKITDV